MEDVTDTSGTTASDGPAASSANGPLIGAHDPGPTERVSATSGARRTARMRRLVRAAKIGGPGVALIVGIATLGQIFHTMYVVPQSLPVTLGFKVDLEPIPGAMERAPFSDLTGLDATIHVTNFGGRNVAVLAGWFELWGYRVESGPSPGRDLVDGSMNRCGPRQNGLYGQEGPNLTLIESGRILDGWTFEPNESADEKRLLLVNPSDFDYVKLDVHAMVVKGSAVKALTDPTVYLASEPLKDDSTGYCRPDITGNLDEPPLYQVAWSARDQSIIPFVGGSDGIAVQWHPIGIDYQAIDGSGPCDPQQAEIACEQTLKVGSYGPDGFAWPLLLACQRDQNELNDCVVAAEMPAADYAPLQERYGLVYTNASVAFPLWRAGPQ